MEWINGFEIVVIEFLQRIGEWFKWPMLGNHRLGV